MVKHAGSRDADRDHRAHVTIFHREHFLRRRGVFVGAICSSDGGRIRLLPARSERVECRDKRKRDQAQRYEDLSRPASRQEESAAKHAF